VVTTAPEQMLDHHVLQARTLLQQLYHHNHSALVALLGSIIRYQLKVLIHVLYVLMVIGVFLVETPPVQILAVLVTIAHLVLRRAAQEEHGQVQLLYQS
jgi:small-conductance mechanosensitive channel